MKQDRPAIIWWKYNHFCVFVGVNDFGDAIIINPDRGRYPLKFNTFKAMYSGVSVFNGEPQETVPPTVVNRLTDAEEVAGMAYVNSELALALIEMEV